MPENKMTFQDWLAIGIEVGWVSEGVCDTHDGLPMTDEEMELWDEGSDPCIPALRVWMENISD